jgi:hypothetical protein
MKRTVCTIKYLLPQTRSECTYKVQCRPPSLAAELTRISIAIELAIKQTICLANKKSTCKRDRVSVF